MLTSASLVTLQELDLSEVFLGLQESVSYRLHSMVGFYGAHYCALVHDERLHQWLMLDDALVRTIGNWSDVLKRCQLGHIQPSVLFFEHIRPDVLCK